MKQRYKNIYSSSMLEIESRVNISIEKGYIPIGAMAIIKIGEQFVYNQTIYCDNPENPNLEEDNYSETMVEAKRLKNGGFSLEAVKLVKELTGLGLKEAKDLVDAL